MDYQLRDRVQKGLSVAYKEQKPSAQKMSTYSQTPTNNFKRAGVGNTGGGKDGTSVGVVNKPKVRSANAFDFNRQYSVEIVNKTRARIG